MSVASDLARYEALIERMARTHRVSVARACRDAQLTPPQLCALHGIEALGRPKMSPLAEALGLSMGAVSTLVDRLVARGLVSRMADESDRRAVHVQLSPLGHSTLQQAVAAKRQVMVQVLETLNENERDSILAALDRLALAWETLDAEEPHVAGACGVE